MTTTTNPHPDVPLPAGAVADGESWDFWDNKFRTFHAPDRFVLDAAGDKVVEICAGGTQLPDGSVDTNTSPPRIDVYICADGGLTADQALALAAQLVEAADLVNQWAGAAR
jgi:hypothetical protein